MNTWLDNNVKNLRYAPFIKSDVLANLPASAPLGALFISTDTFAWYRYNGAGWDLIGGAGVGDITGGGTVGELAKFTGARVIADAVAGVDYVKPSALAGYVPYTGATANVNLGAFNASANTFISDNYQAANVGGVSVKNALGQTVALMGAGNSQGTTFNGQANGTTFNASEQLIFGGSTTQDQYVRTFNSASTGRKGLNLSDGAAVDMKIYTGGDQTLGDFQEGVRTMVIGTGYQGGGGSLENILFHSTGIGNLLALSVPQNRATHYLPTTFRAATTFNSLSGSGNRIAYVNTNNILGTMVIGSGLAFDGTTLTATGGSSGTIAGGGTAGYVPVFTGASSIGNSIIQANANNVYIYSATSGAIMLLSRNSGSYNWWLGIKSANSEFAIYNNSVDEMFLINANNGDLTLGNGQNVKARFGRNFSDYGEVEYSGGSMSVINRWANNAAYVQQLVNGQSVRLYGTGIYELNRSSEGTFLSLLTAGNGRFLLGTDVSGNVQLRTGNSVNISIGVNNAALSIVSGGAATFVSTITATSFIRSGGTSAQFLKGDGSVDNNAYLPLTGGTLTGALFGTSVSMSGDIAANGGVVRSSQPQIDFLTSGGAALPVSVNNLLVSDTYSDRTNVPTNGAYIKGKAIVNRLVANGATGNNVDSIQSGGGSILSNLYRAEGIIANSNTTISAIATTYISTDGNNYTYTLPNNSNLQGGIFLFYKQGAGTITLSGSIINKSGAAVSTYAITSASGMTMVYYNGNDYFVIN